MWRECSGSELPSVRLSGVPDSRPRPGCPEAPCSGGTERLRRGLAPGVNGVLFAQKKNISKGTEPSGSDQISFRGNFNHVSQKRKERKGRETRKITADSLLPARVFLGHQRHCCPPLALFVPSPAAGLGPSAGGPAGCEPVSHDVSSLRRRKALPRGSPSPAA